MEQGWSLIVGHEPGLLGWTLLALGLGLALSEALMGLRRAYARRSPRGGDPERTGPSRKLGAAWAVLVLRVLALAMLAAVILELGLRVQTYAGASRRLVILVDHSATMSLPDAAAGADPGEDTTRRWDRLKQLWQAGAEAREGWRGGDGETLEIEVRGFGARTTALSRSDAEALALEPDAEASNLTRALVELGELAGPAGRGLGEGAPLAGVLVISDGLVARGSAEAEHLQAVAAALEVPVSTVAVGGPTIRDLAIAELHVGEFAFVENVTEFSAELLAHGFDGETVEVELRRDGEVVASDRLKIEGDDDRQTIRVEIAPDRTGQFVYEFRVRPTRDSPAEASTANNARAFVIKVLRDKVRVLHVAGRPDWDVRALRTLLKRDPNVELLSYYILRDWDDTLRDDGTAPLSLIAFPTEELFREQLGSFDLIVMHNFDAVSHDTYLDNVADYVREGGSLVVIGGDLGLATGDYGDPALAPLMPIDTRVPAGLDREPFSPVLTTAGVRHPITAWLAESGRVDWRDLPALDSFNPGSYARDGEEIGAVGLLEHPGKKGADGRQAPLLAVAEPGKGRVMTLATGATWRLGFAPDLPLIDGARPYDLLWLGAVRWLLRDASADRLILEVGQREHALGDPVDLSVRTVSASYAPEAEVEVEVEVRRLDQPLDLGADPSEAVTRSLRTDGLGRAATRIDALPAGAYEALAWRAGEPAPATRAKADARESEDEDGPAPELGTSARRVFLVGGGGSELATVDADAGSKLLRELAEASDGVFVSAIDGDPLPARLPLADADNLERQATGREDRSLWDRWPVLLLLLASLGGEWILRRRLGLA
ncbi:MAG: hypothetical protein KC431_14260 [Myxococcales bacterium]|nr:hypothetical protein [Myxococcales bacterium]